MQGKYQTEVSTMIEKAWLQSLHIDQLLAVYKEALNSSNTNKQIQNLIIQKDVLWFPMETQIFFLQLLHPFWSRTISKKDYSWSQIKVGLMRFGLVICIGAARVQFTYRSYYSCFAGSFFIKNVKLDFSKPLEDKKPSQQLTSHYTCSTYRFGRHSFLHEILQIS